MDFKTERAKIQQELEQIKAAANLEIGKRLGQLEFLAKLEQEETKEQDNE